MTDHNAGQSDWNGNDQTIPLVPDAGYAEPTLQPLPEETLLDATAGSDPWASGPGMGEPHTPEPTRSLSTPPAPEPSPQSPSSSYGAPVGYPPPAAYPRPEAYPQPATSPAPAWGSSPAPDRASGPGASGYPQRPYATYPEPDGPAAGIGNQSFPTYAASGYAGQAWPAVVDPVAYDYGYNRTPTAPHPNAVISMVLGILGLVAFAPLAPFAWHLAAKGRREMAYEPGRWAPSGMLTAGMVMGVVGTILLVLGVLFFLFIFGIFTLAGA